jgi:hypothetical protein
VNKRLRILELIESGQISVEEGVRRLEALDRSQPEPIAAAEDEVVRGAPADVGPPGAEPEAAPRAESQVEPIHLPLVRIVWQIVLGVGIAVVAGGGFLLARAYGREGAPGLTWGWVLFALGLLVLLLGWWLQRARWFYLRVREHDGSAFTIALPLPLGLVFWVLRIAKPFVPQLQEMDVDQLVLAMRDELRAGRSFAINVDEGEGGDQVEMYFC